MGRASHFSGWPAELVDVFERSTTCEYASLTRAGVPVSVPLGPFVGEGTLDVSTGLAFPAKAERARRNPKVALLFADPIGVGMSEAPVVLVQGHAAVRDADLQAGTDRYVRDALAKYPAVAKGQPRFMLRRLAWYWARIWVEVTPVRIRWWPDRDLATQPREWRAGSDLELPASDPAPPGRQPPPWLDPPREWRTVASSALARLPLADLTVVNGDGYPLCVPVSTRPLVGEQVPIVIGDGAPELPPGPACLTLHGHPEIYTGEENHTFMGTLANDGSQGVRLQVDRVLADWSITGNRLRSTIDFLAKGRRLVPRVKAEAARRGQPVPQVNLP
jgi:hypothetical protein